jgi:hypothetical protein
VEYLVTGQETKHSVSLASLEPETRSLIQVAGELPATERYTLLQFAKKKTQRLSSIWGLIYLDRLRPSMRLGL